MQSLRFLCRILAFLFALASAPGHGSTLGYWRFEPGQFVADSAGKNPLKPVGGDKAPAFYALPNHGAGSAFPNPIPATRAPNRGAAQFTGQGCFAIRSTAELLAGREFTIEVCFNATYIRHTNASMLASHWNSNADRGWFFGIINLGGQEIPHYQLRFGVTPEGGEPNNQNTNFARDVLVLGQDYYAAVSYKEGTATTYLKNLTMNGKLLTSVITGLDDKVHRSSASFEIGSYNGGGNGFNGWIDEVRFSNSALAANQLLVSTR